MPENDKSEAHANPSIADKLGHWARNSVVLRLITICILVLLLLIPMAMIRDLIDEREDRKNETINEITSKWAGEQFVAGPILTIPYEKKLKTADGDTITRLYFLNMTPRNLDINSVVDPQVKQRGIFKAVLYTSSVSLSGSFDAGSLESFNTSATRFRWEDAFISIHTDMSAINNNMALHWGGQTNAFKPTIPTGEASLDGVHARISGLKPALLEAGIDFSVSMELKGSSMLMFAPVGRTTTCNMKSSWATPSFDGTIITDTNTVSDSGFTASWTVLEFNRSMPNAWIDDEFDFDVSEYYYYDEPWEAAASSWFGLKLLLPADAYQQSMRTAKYAILFIVLTFTIFFIIEILNRKRIHAVQYVLVGLALTLFYSLLLALAEFTSFFYAYLVASIVIIGLITFYTGSIFKNRRLTWITGSTLVVLYTYIYVILQQSDYAFLLGNLGLLIALAAVMFSTRKLDWYSLAQRKAGD